MAWDYFSKTWQESKSSVIFKKLPVLVVDEKCIIAQISIILRYIEKIADLNIDSDILAA